MSRFDLFLDLFGKGLAESFSDNGEIRPAAFLSFVAPLVLTAEFSRLLMPPEPSLLEFSVPTLMLILSLRTVRRRLATVGWSDWYFLALCLPFASLVLVVALGRETRGDLEAENITEKQ